MIEKAQPRYMKCKVCELTYNVDRFCTTPPGKYICPKCTAKIQAIRRKERQCRS